MSASDIIASLALIISLVSFWLSYRAARLTKMVSAAEKRTQAHSILVGVLLEAEELLSDLRECITSERTDITIANGLNGLESQLVAISESIPERLDWLREKDFDDPILLEEYKIFALEAESRVKKVAPMIRGLRIKIKGPQPA